MKISHELKVWPNEFQAIVSEIKSWEFRLNDRGYQLSDFVNLKECDKINGFTGREIIKEIVYILLWSKFWNPRRVLYIYNKGSS